MRSSPNIKPPLMKRLQICTVVYWKCLTSYSLAQGFLKAVLRFIPGLHIYLDTSLESQAREVLNDLGQSFHSRHVLGLPLKIKNDFSCLLSRHSMLLGDIMHEFDRKAHRLKPSSNSGATLHITGLQVT